MPTSVCPLAPVQALRVLLSALLLSLPLASWGQACAVPRFEPFRAPSLTPQDQVGALEISMRPFASLRVPAGFARIGPTMTVPGVLVGQHPRGLRGAVSFDTRESVAREAEGGAVAPVQFVQGIFEGRDAQACRHLAALKLDEQDYRVRAELSHGARLYAYGRGGSHRFHLTRPDQPELALAGRFDGMSRAEFEAVLASLELAAD